MGVSLMSKRPNPSDGGLPHKISVTFAIAVPVIQLFQMRIWLSYRKFSPRKF
jgi:hypothetical protein